MRRLTTITLSSLGLNDYRLINQFRLLEGYINNTIYLWYMLVMTITFIIVIVTNTKRVLSFEFIYKGGRPREEPTNVRSIRVPDRVWKLVNKKYRTINEYLLSPGESFDKKENAKEVTTEKNYPLKRLRKGVSNGITFKA